MRSWARSRPRTVTRSLDAAAIAVLAAPGLPISMALLPASEPARFPPAANGCRTIVGQYQRGERAVSNAAASQRQGRARSRATRRASAARTRRRMARPSPSSSNGCARTFWPGGSRRDRGWSKATSPPASRVSRGPVREALRRLTADGLIEHWPHRGAVVRRLTRARDPRTVLRSGSKWRRSPRGSPLRPDAPERRARFVDAIQPIYADAPRDPCEYLEENAAFHDAVMALAGNLAAARSGGAAAIAAHHGPGRRRADASRARGVGAASTAPIAAGDPRSRPGSRVGAHARPSRTGRRARAGEAGGRRPGSERARRAVARTR